eukprot:1157475-Pelagomonas_calceolata.AAC.3
MEASMSRSMTARAPLSRSCARSQGEGVKQTNTRQARQARQSQTGQGKQADRQTSTWATVLEKLLIVGIWGPMCSAVHRQLLRTPTDLFAALSMFSRYSPKARKENPTSPPSALPAAYIAVAAYVGRFHISKPCNLHFPAKVLRCISACEQRTMRRVFSLPLTSLPHASLSVVGAPAAVALATHADADGCRVGNT